MDLPTMWLVAQSYWNHNNPSHISYTTNCWKIKDTVTVPPALFYTPICKIFEVVFLTRIVWHPAFKSFAPSHILTNWNWFAYTRLRKRTQLLNSGLLQTSWNAQRPLHSTDIRQLLRKWIDCLLIIIIIFFQELWHSCWFLGNNCCTTWAPWMENEYWNASAHTAIQDVKDW